MNCPDIESLIAFGLGESEDQELAAHVQTCDGCKGDVETIRLLAGVGVEEWELSEEMIEEIVATLPDPEPPKTTPWIRGLHLGLTAVLGTLTAMLSTVFTGAITTTGPEKLLVLVITFGALCMLMNARRDWGPGSGVSLEVR